MTILAKNRSGLHFLHKIKFFFKKTNVTKIIEEILELLKSNFFALKLIF